MGIFFVTVSPSPKQSLLGWLLRTRGSSVPERTSLRDNFQVLTQPELRLLLFWKPRYNGGDSSSNYWPVLCTCYARDLPSSPHQPRAERTINIPTLRTRRLRQGTPSGWHGSRPPPGAARVGSWVGDHRAGMLCPGNTHWPERDHRAASQAGGTSPAGEVPERRLACLI